MSTNRRLNLRKNKSNNKDGNQSISNFIERRSKDVEIVEDDDDVVQVTEEYDESVLRPLRRRKKKIAVVDEEEDEEDNALELGGIEDMDEEEKQQIKEALRQSRLEMEKDKKRREIYKKFQNSKFNVESEMPTTSTADIPSSPISSSIEPSGMERAESPDLFGPTPQSNIEKDEKVDVASGESSSSKNDFKSFPLQKEISIQLSPVQRPSTKKNQSSAKIDSCQETAPHNEQPTKSKSPPSSVTSKEKGRISKSLDSKKRKHSIEDDSDYDGYDGAKENIKEPPKVETRKRQKTIQDNFSMLTPKKQNKEANKPKETNLDENRNTTTQKYKKSSKVTLKRKYKKNRPPIKTIRDAMKARLFFAPPGINQKLYTLAIMRMLDHSKECIRKAQQRSLQFAKWGEPIVVGPREVDSLDAKKDKRKSNHINKESLHGPPELRTKRNLRSTQSKVSEPTKTETNSNKDIKSEKYSTEKKVKTEKFDFVTSDDSDEELTKSVFGHKEKNPKSWTEYNSRTDSFKFGENVNTSATRVVKDDEQNDKNILDNNMEKKDVESHVGLKQKCDNNNDLGVKIEETTSKFDNEDELSFQNSNSPTAADRYFTDNITTATSSEAKINNDTCNITRKSHNKDKEEHNVRTDIDNSSKLTSNNENALTKSVKEQCNSDTNDSDDGIDSSAEIGKLKVKRSSKRKSAVIEDIEEEADEKTCGTATRVDVEMIDVDDIITPTGSNNTKPGESLTSSASKSGFLKASRTEIKPPAVQRKITSAAQKAAEAAEKRMRQEKIGQPSGSGINLSKNDSFSKENVVQCPICYSDFPFQDIEAHAGMCNGTPPDLDQTGKQDRRRVAVEQGQNSPSLQQSQEYGLKDLKVVVTRSPEAQRRLVDKLGNRSNLKAKRNLSLMKKEKVNTKKVVADVVDMTSDDDDDSPKDMNDGSPNKDETEGASKSSLDEWPTESQETRKRAKYKVTYGGRKKTGPKSPFSSVDYIPLQEQPPSSDSESDSTTRNPKEQRPPPSARTLQTTPNDCVDIESDSDSEKEIYSMYGAKKPSARRNINDVLRPQKQDLTFKKKKIKTKQKDEFDEEDDENEKALMELAGISSNTSSDHKHPPKDNKPKATKRRRKRATISSDDSEENDGCILCYVCNKHVPKEIYPDHTETCISRKEGSAVTPSKQYDDETHTAQSTRRTSNKQTAKPSSSNTVEMDSDEIGNSPIKTFKLIGEGEGSAVDYDNQFAFLGKNTRSSSKRGSKGGRGQGRGQYKKKYWRKRKSNRQ